MHSTVQLLDDHHPEAAALGFDDTAMQDWLEAASAQQIDDAPFGIVAMAPDGIVVAYNKAEAAAARLNPSRVVGQHFFRSVAPCTNNALIAGRFEAGGVLDATIDYVFTLRMLPTPVRLRLLRDPAARRMYLLVERRTAHGG